MTARWLGLPLRGPPLALGVDVGQVAVLVVFVVAAFIAVVYDFYVLRAVFGNDDSVPPERLTNCPSCGARVSVEADTCGYCEAPIDR